jgi:hypothetical protein
MRRLEEAPSIHKKLRKNNLFRHKRSDIDGNKNLIGQPLIIIKRSREK